MNITLKSGFIASCLANAFLLGLLLAHEGLPHPREPLIAYDGLFTRMEKAAAVMPAQDRDRVLAVVAQRKQDIGSDIQRIQDGMLVMKQSLASPFLDMAQLRSADTAVTEADHALHKDMFVMISDIAAGLSDAERRTFFGEILNGPQPSGDVPPFAPRNGAAPSTPTPAGPTTGGAVSNYIDSSATTIVPATSTADSVTQPPAAVPAIPAYNTQTVTGASQPVWGAASGVVGIVTQPAPSPEATTGAPPPSPPSNGAGTTPFPPANPGGDNAAAPPGGQSPPPTGDTTGPAPQNQGGNANNSPAPQGQAGNVNNPPSNASSNDSAQSPQAPPSGAPPQGSPPGGAPAPGPGPSGGFRGGGHR
jgi:hypothetical protein